MLKNFKYWLGFCTLLFAHGLYAQRPQVEMADQLRSSGKIYVVVIILGVLFAGIVLYLISIDRKVSKLEKEINRK